MEQRLAWTDERVQQIIESSKKGMSAQEIADQIGGVSRSAVIGKLHRLGAGEHASERKFKLNRVAQARERKAPKLDPDTRPRVEIEAVYVAPHNRRGLIDRLDDQCRWPIGEPGTSEFHYCDQTRILGKSYCPHHDHIAHPPEGPRRPFVPYPVISQPVRIKERV